ncbi:MAG: hypothetical protein HZC55_24105 [Verrucomicrobia bacterium]|nr:hypothetical protein [Verrucomicrobiota bacterium]
MSAPSLQTVHGQPSWPLRSSHVHAHLTRLGGHLGPVSFRLDHRTVSPLSIAPWAEEPVAKGTPPLLRALRGDFFCAPFGGNGTPWRGEQHPPHGETANANWRLQGVERTDEGLALRAGLDLRVRRGRVEKVIRLREGEPVVYQRHVISGARGAISVGHHAMVKFPEQEGAGLVSTSRFVRAQVLPDPFERPEARGYSSLQTGAEFRSLDRVPLLTGGTTDVSVFPARRGYDDLVMLTADPRLSLAWTAVAFPVQRYAYFALRDPRQLPHTLLWISNGGRHYPPWNGRHTAVMGLEDTASYFHYGLAESVRPNPVSRRGHATAVRLHPRRPTVISYVFGVVELPAGFRRVAEIRPSAGGIELVSSNGKRARAELDLGWLQG